MDFFDGSHYKINKVLLSFIGQWPYQTISRKNVTLFVLLLLSGIQVIAAMCALVTSFDEVDVLLEDLSIFFPFSAGIMKLLNCSIQTKKMKILMDRIKTDIISYTNAGNVHVLKKYAKDGRRFSIIYATFVYVAMVICTITPMKPVIFNTLNETTERPMIQHVEYFVDNQRYYYFIILQTYVAIFISISAIVAIDTMFLIFIQHACGLFSTLGYQLHHLANEEMLSSDIYPSKKNDKSYRNIAECVYRHKKAIEFADLLESYYSTSFFLQAGLSTIGISVTGFQAFRNMDDTAKLFQQVTLSSGHLTHLFFECMCGQRLIDHSDRMNEYLINVEWYQTSIRTRKIINFIVIRSQKPCTLTAANMFDISMKTFGTIVRTAMSYFTVLRSTQ